MMDCRVYENIGETLYSGLLPNGLHVDVVKKPGYAKSFALFAANYGGADRRFLLAGQWRDTPAGVAHFLEHKMFDTPDGGNALNVLSANGASPNAFTSQGMTAYHFESTVGFEDNLRTLLRFVSVPYFTPESVAKEQGIIGQEIRMTEDSPDFAIYINLMRSLYAVNPVRDSVAGTVESIAQITADTLFDCHKVFYNPSNMALCVVGDLDPERVLAIASELLPPEPGEVPGRDYGEAEKPTPDRARYETVMPVSAPQLLIGAKIAPAGAGMARLRQILTGELALHCLIGQSSPLYTGLYSKGLLNRDFSYELDFSAGTATFLAGGESRDPEAVLAAFSEQVDTVIRSGLDEQLFSRGKRALFGARLRGLGSFSSLAVSLAEGRFTGWCPLDAFPVLESLESGECAAFLTEYLKPDRLSLSVIRPVA
jgi:predicted Zn-dependent peptidase